MSAPESAAAAVRDGEIQLRGRVLPASNLTFFGEAALADEVVRCVYKPVAGERPLWDFPDGTLAAREVAAYAVSEALGWNVAPLTVLRGGPAGHGMVQLWCDPDEEQNPVDIVPVDRLPAGYLHVLDAIDGEGHEVSLVHEDSAPLRRMAVFDAIVNNADRKGGHVLAMTGGHRFGVDHGVSFHVDNKLRTVLWGWAGDRLHPEDRQALARLCDESLRPGERLRADLGELLAPLEVEAFEHRVRALIEADRMPLPSAEWPAIPWPAF